MVLQLYGYIQSTCTKRVALTLHEKNVPFVFHNVDIVKGEQKSTDHKAKQPFGQVPFIDDDGFVVFESRAICRYIEEKHSGQGTKLVPDGLQKRTLFEQAASIEQANFDPFAAPLAFEALIKKRYGLETDPAKVTDLTQKLNQKLDGYETILSKQKYLAGDVRPPLIILTNRSVTEGLSQLQQELTLADLFHLPYGTLVNTAGINVIRDRPNVARWFADISGRPAWHAVKDGVKSTA
ncbi:Glutathione S-transferase F12 [Leucoagaricus sp. SymC.cos]|nr:Glutathione S-transferase F12 [Leucoagaricus sp. SymC.cos]